MCDKDLPWEMDEPHKAGARGARGYMDYVAEADTSPNSPDHMPYVEMTQYVPASTTTHVEMSLPKSWTTVSPWVAPVVRYPHLNFTACRSTPTRRVSIA